MSFSQYIKIFFIFFFSVFDSTICVEKKFHNVDLITDLGRFREASKIGFSDISFNLAKYFGKFSDQKSFEKQFSSEFQNEIILAVENLEKYLKSLANKKTKIIIDKITEFHALVKNALKSPKQKLSDFIKKAQGVLIQKKEVKSVEHSLSKLLEMIGKHKSNEKCGLHSAGREILSTFVLVQAFAALKLNQNKQKSQEFINFMKNIDYSLKVISLNGTKETFACTPKEGFRAKKNNKFVTLMKKVEKIYVGEMKATQGNVITGARFRHIEDILYIQIKERKLLPFGVTSKPIKTKMDNESYTTLPEIQKDSKDLQNVSYLNCKLLLTKHLLAPDQVLVGVQLKIFKENDKCYIGLVATGKKVDLLTAEFHNYERQYYFARSNFSVSHTYLFRSKHLKEEHIIGDEAHALSVSFVPSPRSIRVLPCFDLQKVESVIPMAQNGIEVVLSRKANRPGFLRLRLISLDIAKHLGAFMKIDKYSEFYQLEKFSDNSI
uniref:CSON012969 protein n=1 Tax=Culicoides sonorensis TaxID=179676 RepID=A0A336M6S1_CULSO